MVFYKITNNNMVVDIFKEQPRYIRYLTNSKRAIAVQKNAANGVMGSDKNTIYHLEGTINNFPDEKITVTVTEIGAEEYNALATQFAIQAKENANLRKRLANVEEQLSTTNDLLTQLLAKLS